MEAREWPIIAYVARHPHMSEETPVLLTGSFERETVRQRPQHFEEHDFRWHLSLPKSAAADAARWLRTAEGRVTMVLRKWGGFWWDRYWRCWNSESTSYVVVGGSLRDLCMHLEQLGHRPPRSEWHVSL